LIVYNIGRPLMFYTYIFLSLQSYVWYKYNTFLLASKISQTYLDKILSLMFRRYWPPTFWKTNLIYNQIKG